MTGIKETKDVINAVLAIRDAIANAKDDGSISILQDYVYFLPALPSLFQAINGADQVPAELTDIDFTEATELRDMLNDAGTSEELQKIFEGIVLIGTGIKGYVAAKKSE